MMAAMQGRPTRAYAVIDQLKQTYDIRTLSTTADKIDPDIDLLMLVHPQGLTDATLYAVDQFAMKGGRILVFTDPYSEVEAAQSNPMTGGGGPTDSNLERLFKSWGVEMVPGKVAADPDRGRLVNVGRNGHASAVGELYRLAQPEAGGFRSDRSGDRRPEDAEPGDGRHPAAGGRRQDHFHAAGQHDQGQRGTERRPGGAPAGRRGAAQQLQERRQEAGTGCARFRRCRQRIPPTDRRPRRRRHPRRPALRLRRPRRPRSRKRISSPDRPAPSRRSWWRTAIFWTIASGSRPRISSVSGWSFPPRTTAISS